MPSTMTSGNTPLRVFAHLPQEIRDVIYGLVLADGHIALIRTSQAMYANTAQSLRKNGIYRAHIEHYRLVPGFNCTLYRPLSSETLSSVQNLDLRITIAGKRARDEKYGDPAYTMGFMIQMVQEMVDAMKNPIYCRFNLQLLHSEKMSIMILLVLETLQVFKQVKVELWQKEDDVGRAFSFIPNLATYAERCQAVARVRSAFNEGQESVDKTRLKIAWTDPKNFERNRFYSTETYEDAE